MNLAEIVNRHLSHEYSKVTKWNNMNAMDTVYIVVKSVVDSCILRNSVSSWSQNIFYPHYVCIFVCMMNLFLAFLLTWVVVDFVIHLLDNVHRE